MPIILLALAACGGQATGPVAGDGSSSGGLPMVQATAVSELALGIPELPGTARLGDASSREYLAGIFPSPYAPVEQAIYVGSGPADEAKAFYDRELAASGYTPEVGWTELNAVTSAASWAKDNVQVRVILNANISAEEAAGLNESLKPAGEQLGAGDTVIYVIGIDRDKTLK